MRNTAKAYHSMKLSAENRVLSGTRFTDILSTDRTSGGIRIPGIGAEPKSLSRNLPYPSTTEQSVHGKLEMYIKHNKKREGCRVHS